MTNLAFTLALLMLFIGLLMSFARLVIGPTRLDRALALEVITMLLFGIGLVVYMQYSQEWLLDLLLIWAIVPFAAPLILTRTLTKRRLT